MPRDLPRIERVIEPDSLACPCGCGEMVRIGEDVSERLDIVPAKLRVLVTIRPKYACPKGRSGVAQAKAPARLIEGGLPTEALIAHIMAAKYCEHLPLYRQWQQFRRRGVTLDRSVLADWVGRTSFHLTPIVARMAELLKQSGKLFLDETTAPVLDPGRGCTKTGYLWALAHDDRPWGGVGSIRPAWCFTMRRGAAASTARRSSRAFTASCKSMATAVIAASPGRSAAAVNLWCWASAGAMPAARSSRPHLAKAHPWPASC